MTEPTAAPVVSDTASSVREKRGSLYFSERPYFKYLIFAAIAVAVVVAIAVPSYKATHPPQSPSPDTGPSTAAPTSIPPMHLKPGFTHAPSEPTTLIAHIQPLHNGPRPTAHPAAATEKIVRRDNSRNSTFHNTMTSDVGEFRHLTTINGTTAFVLYTATAPTSRGTPKSKPGKIAILVALLVSAAMGLQLPAVTEAAALSPNPTAPATTHAIREASGLGPGADGASMATEGIGNNADRTGRVTTTTRKDRDGPGCAAVTSTSTIIGEETTSYQTTTFCSIPTSRRSAASGMRPGMLGLVVDFLVSVVAGSQSSNTSESATRASSPAAIPTFEPEAHSSISDDDWEYCESDTTSSTEIMAVTSIMWNTTTATVTVERSMAIVSTSGGLPGASESITETGGPSTTTVVTPTSVTTTATANIERSKEYASTSGGPPGVSEGITDTEEPHIIILVTSSTTSTPSVISDTSKSIGKTPESISGMPSNTMNETATVNSTISKNATSTSEYTTSTLSASPTKSGAVRRLKPGLVALVFALLVSAATTLQLPRTDGTAMSTSNGHNMTLPTPPIPIFLTSHSSNGPSGSETPKTTTATVTQTVATTQQGSTATPPPVSAALTAKPGLVAPAQALLASTMIVLQQGPSDSGAAKWIDTLPEPTAATTSQSHLTAMSADTQVDGAQQGVSKTAEYSSSVMDRLPPNPVPTWPKEHTNSTAAGHVVTTMLISSVDVTKTETMTQSGTTTKTTTATVTSCSASSSTTHPSSTSGASKAARSGLFTLVVALFASVAIATQYPGSTAVDHTMTTTLTSSVDVTKTETTRLTTRTEPTIARVTSCTDDLSTTRPPQSTSVPSTSSASKTAKSGIFALVVALLISAAAAFHPSTATTTTMSITNIEPSTIATPKITATETNTGGWNSSTSSAPLLIDTPCCEDYWCSIFIGCAPVSRATAKLGGSQEGEGGDGRVEPRGDTSGQGRSVFP